MKFDNGKPKISLVPTKIIWDIAKVREYGVQKYRDPDNWKKVEVQRYIDALLRHTLKFWKNPYGKDEESGMPHLWHIACNVAFLCELMDEEKEIDKCWEMRSRATDVKSGTPSNVH